MSHFNYDQILITGGEPLLYYQQLIGCIQAMRVVTRAKIYVYTAMTVYKRTFKPIYSVIKYVDGITLTLHTQEDVDNFKQVLYSITASNKIAEAFAGKSLRLNIFEGLDVSGLDLSDWIVKDNMVWIKDCPLPDDEEFRRI